MMRELRWERGKSARELAAAWGVPLSTVHNTAVEASRLVATELDEGRDELRVVMQTRLERVLVHGGDRDAVAAADLTARLLGLLVERHDVTTTTAEAVTSSAAWRELHGILARALEPYPEAAAAVVRELERYARGEP